jgi:hypothetical protein
MAALFVMFLPGGDLRYIMEGLLLLDGNLDPVGALALVSVGDGAKIWPRLVGNFDVQLQLEVQLELQPKSSNSNAHFDFNFNFNMTVFSSFFGNVTYTIHTAE